MMTTYPVTWLSYDEQLGDLIPIPPNTKRLDKAGFTGAQGRAVTDEDRRSWAHEDGNVILHLSDEVIGIDIDDYAWMENGVGHEKNGFADQDALAEAVGLPLPRTWISTGRDPGDDELHVSGIRFYRVPAGFVANMDRLAGNIELITRTYRYAVVWPSRVKDDRGDRVYRWYAPGSRVPADEPPELEDLTPLPQVYLDYISNAADAPQKFGRVPDLSPEDVYTDYARAHCNAVMASVRAELEECLTLDEGETDSRGNTWEKAVADAARNIWRMVWTPGSPVYGYPMQGLGLFLETVPPEMQADGLSYDVRAKWKAEEEPTHRDKGPLMVLKPEQRAALDFSAEIVKPQDQRTHRRKERPRFASIAKTPINMAIDIVAFTADRARYSLDEQSWWVYNESRGKWEASAASNVQQARSIIDELSDTMDSGDPDADKGTPLYQQHKRFQMLTHPSQRGGLAALVVDRALRYGVKTADMDSDPEKLWAGGQCWDLRTGELATDVPAATPHEKSCAVGPVPGDFPRFQRLLDAAMPDPAHQEMWWGLMGDATAGYSGRVLGILWGQTGLGKSALMTLVAKVLDDYAAPIPAELLSSQATPHMVMDLRGVRFAYLDEGLSPSAKSSWERVKSLTSGAQQIGARKFRSAVRFTPSHTLFLTDNKQPTVADPALRDRTKALEVRGDKEAVRRAAFAVFGTDGGRAWLAEEGPAVLARLMAWAGRVVREGSNATIVVPQDVSDQLDDLAREQDPVSAWMDECTEGVKESQDWTKVGDLYLHFAHWAEVNGYPGHLSIAQFGQRLTDLDVGKEARAHNAKYRSITIREEA